MRARSDHRAGDQVQVPIPDDYSEVEYGLVRRYFQEIWNIDHCRTNSHPGRYSVGIV